MTAAAAQILEQFRKFPQEEKLQLCEAVLRESISPSSAASRRKTVAQVAGNYRPQPDVNAKDHDRGFAAAIDTSKAPQQTR